MSRRYTEDEFILHFWEKVDVRGLDDCWEWMAKSKNEGGYGILKHNRKMAGAHRISYVLKFGEIPDGMCVLHKCDNRSCVNPKHLFLGTKSDNTRDMDRKGRRIRGDVRGDKGPSSVLTEEQVVNIRRMYASGEYYQRELGIIFGVEQVTISTIVTRKTWTHLK